MLNMLLPQMSIYLLYLVFDTIFITVLEFRVAHISDSYVFISALCKTSGARG